MTILANIAVYQCDHCHSVIACHDEPTWKIFETLWHETVFHQFCGVCRRLPEVVGVMINDRARMLDILEQRRDDRVASKPGTPEAEYAN